MIISKDHLVEELSLNAKLKVNSNETLFFLILYGELFDIYWKTPVQKITVNSNTMKTATKIWRYNNLMGQDNI